ncbi:uncharacterized protein N0V89_005399 [Didymosphaeria variabile]|uniref:Pre-rRNA-processing protein RIX1 n=1 Tax=Didymosphaeria variabile TaxID=1932322 RepID=A0A9W8XLK2_9PLEO|nr:uncharacterized protein N0V89_005399 [Didymosphaeria variabile]KAJ4353669.1 hypothetical protein N0V89_005399 [Didymosphaeria variabile]
MATELATLRAVTFRISSTNTSQLPQHVPAIAASLASCRTLLSSAQASSSKTASEASVAVHRYRTLLSTLLQDRTIQGRWAAIVLIKSTIEVGGWETLQKSLPWVRGLLGILTKPDPFSSKQLCIITLTRIFFLTRDYPTLVREITTPSLSPFIQSALQIAASRTSPALLETIIESFDRLLPRHPTTFRSHLKQIQQLLGQTIAPTPSSKLGPEQATGIRPDVTLAVSEAARRLYTQIPCSAPKGATAEEWQVSFKKTIDNAHRVSDKVFRAVVEDFKSSSRDATTTNGHTLDDEVQDINTDPMSLPPWSGIFAGGERLLGLLELIKTYILCPTTIPVNVNIGAVVVLLTRLLSLTIPSAKGQGFLNAIKFNNQVSKEERENLWLILPNIHVAAIDILLALTHRSDTSTVAIDAAMLDQMVWVFAAERNAPEVRTACYSAVAELLRRSGVALPKSSIDSLGDMIRRCCDDILPLEQNAAQAKQSAANVKTNGNTQATTNADAFLKAPKAHNVSGDFAGLHAAAYTLLPAAFTHIRPQHLSDSLRARMDRTAILVRDKDAMMASVLNPPPSKKFGKPAASILPFLARSQSGEKEVEALIRPRMPVIRMRTYESEDVEGDEKEQMLEDVEGDDEFVGNELDTLLGTVATSGVSGGDIVMAEAVDMGATATTAVESNDRSAEILERANAVGKRPQEDGASLAPPKRVKVSEVPKEPHVSTLPRQPSIAMPTTIVAPGLEAPAVVSDLPAASISVAPPVSVTSAVPPTTAEKPAEEDSEEDDDDKISLVLGQDTESESE